MRCFFFFGGDSIVADRAIIKGDDVVVLVSGAKTRLSQKRWRKSWVWATKDLF